MIFDLCPLPTIILPLLPRKVIINQTTNTRILLDLFQTLYKWNRRREIFLKNNNCFQFFIMIKHSINYFYHKPCMCSTPTGITSDKANALILFALKVEAAAPHCSSFPSRAISMPQWSSNSMRGRASCQRKGK